MPAKHPKTLPSGAWPLPANPAGAARLTENFAAIGPAEARFAASREGRAILAALGGNAPFLADQSLRESACLRRAVKTGPEATCNDIIKTLAATRPRQATPAIARALRLAKGRAALVIALADLGGLWDLAQVTAALSRLAEASLVVAVEHLLTSLHQKGDIKLPHPATPARDCGFVALALGKLGAGELNYSSDIDLVLLFDSQNPAYRQPAQPIMVRLARELVNLLSHRDENGYVFRVDLRLRPDPAATPPVVSLATALAYYESHGRTWERAAFSKARPVAGDLRMGREFLTTIRPFIWRRHLDFAAIDEIRDMKRRIDSGRDQDLPGFDVKLGRGGIREIEFMVQTLSLVWGGQEPALRIPATLQALPALARAGHLPRPAARRLAADYRQLRRVEHRLQMIADRQTHALPTTMAELANFAIFLGQPRFTTEFPKLLARVHDYFLALFDAGQELVQTIDPGSAGPPPAAFTAQLKQLRFSSVAHIAERLRAWLGGAVPALRADRARLLLIACLPQLLRALGRQPEPDRAFARFDTMISRQRAGVPLLSLFTRNPALLDRLAAVLGAAPALAEHLALDSHALEALLNPTARFTSPRPVLRRMLRDAADLEDALAITRRFVRREEFHLSVATLESRLDADAAGRLRADLAEAALGALLPRVLAAHRARYGRIRGAAFAIVALGKTGGAEMLAGSDLDLMLIYSHAPAATAPTGWFVRLAHAVTGALTAQGPEGLLYKVDMRLRPSGNQGPVAVSLAAFRRYHAAQSWTWERLALTRARVLAATAGFRRIVAAEILTALSRPDSPGTIRADVRAMRDRLAHELPGKGRFDVKHRPGGMLELAFIPEALQLIHGPAAPHLFRPNTTAALQALAACGHLRAADAGRLIAADHLWRSIQGILRITGMSETEAAPPPAMAAPLLAATATPDLGALQTRMAQAARDVQDCFAHYLGDTL